MSDPFPNFPISQFLNFPICQLSKINLSTVQPFILVPDTPLRQIGFPSPAASYLEEPLSLDRLLVSHPSATFFLRADGDAMVADGIRSGDILVVDRSLPAATGHLVIAHVGDDLLMRRLERRDGRAVLVASDPALPVLDCAALGDAYQYFGTVTTCIHRF